MGSGASDGRAPGVAIRIGRIAWRDRALFENFSLTLKAGAWTCLLGASGVGKTTLLRLLVGVSPALSDGAAEALDGRPLAGRVAYMAQSDLLLPWRSALDNVRLGPSLRRSWRSSPAKSERDRARALLAAVGLEAAAEKFPAELSGGMRQRVALARTLMEDRPVVAMDEPFSALDAVTRHRLQDLAAELLRDRTVLMVTHDPAEALRLGHVIHVLGGLPAKIEASLAPSGAPPRARESFIAEERDLLARLALADEAAA